MPATHSFRPPAHSEPTAARLKIAVLSHARDPFPSQPYLLGRLVESWKRSGHEVFILQGPERHQAADLLFLHINLTVIPEEYLRFSRRYPVVINGLARDISKRCVSTHLVSARDGYAGPVIVKTNRNCGGSPERRLLQSSGLSRLIRRAARVFPWSWTGNLATHEYPLFETTAEVPRAVWTNPRLVVEKFLPEREGEHYCIRQWVFLGPREFNQRVFSLHPIVKANNVVHREYDLPVPEELRDMRSRMGFDYGKFDYVVVDGRTVLFDANRTPASNPKHNNSNQRVTEITDELAEGIHAFACANPTPLR